MNTQSKNHSSPIASHKELTVKEEEEASVTLTDGDILGIDADKTPKKSNITNHKETGLSDAANVHIIDCFNDQSHMNLPVLQNETREEVVQHTGADEPSAIVESTDSLAAALAIELKEVEEDSLTATTEDIAVAPVEKNAVDDEDTEEERSNASADGSSQQDDGDSSSRTVVQHSIKNATSSPLDSELVDWILRSIGVLLSGVGACLVLHAVATEQYVLAKNIIMRFLVLGRVWISLEALRVFDKLVEALQLIGRLEKERPQAPAVINNKTRYPPEFELVDRIMRSDWIISSLRVLHWGTEVCLAWYSVATKEYVLPTIRMLLKSHWILTQRRPKWCAKFLAKIEVLRPHLDKLVEPLRRRLKSSSTTGSGIREDTSTSRNVRVLVCLAICVGIVSFGSKNLYKGHEILVSTIQEESKRQVQFSPFGTLPKAEELARFPELSSSFNADVQGVHDDSSSSSSPPCKWWHACAAAVRRPIFHW